MDWTKAAALDREPDAALPAHIHEVSFDGRVAVHPLPDDSPTSCDVLVGAVEGVRWFARCVAEPTGETVTFRESPNDVVATASALVRWHASDPRCERCHATTQPVDQGRRRQCQECGRLLFFRTDPAVIMAVTDPADRLLLARHASWPEGRMSVIAGFVEVGESLEQACAREAMEEVGLHLHSFEYFGSQPWPFPRSLMLGFTARTDNADALRVDGEEIVEASFLTREELTSRLAAQTITLPGSSAIGRALIDHWLLQ
ncbi:MAG: NAD(+) diphosphatase [Propionibacteriaceae bacterium]|nr:NAD(+) diphosphatase [Propionibacteriaceae bacterium]